jgi:hypothetical protein
MALSTLPTAVPTKLGGSGFENADTILTIATEIKTLATQLGTMTMWVGAGAAANTNIPVTNIKATATVLMALHIQPPAAGSGDTIKTNLLTDTVTVTAGNIKFTNTATNATNEQVLLLYCNHD